jgi:hypothetical protein
MGAKLSLSLVDDYGRTTRRTYEMVTQADLAAYETAVAAVLVDLAAVTDLGVVRADLVIEDISAGFAVTADANVDVGATFTGYVEGGGGKKASHKLPGIKESLVGADGSIPLTGVVAAWLTDFEADGANLLLISDGEEIDYWLAGALDR